MVRSSRKWLVGAVTALAVLLVACGEDAGEPDSGAADEQTVEDAAEVDEDAEADGGTAESTDGDDAEEADTDDADEGSGGDAAAAGGGLVLIGDERFEADEITCPDSMSGVEFFGEAEGPRDNARIHGRFDSSLPELIGVSFARGDEGEWAAIAENEVLDRGVLEDYAFDIDARTFSGNATFIWVQEDGLMDLDSLTDGTFEISCS